MRSKLSIILSGLNTLSRQLWLSISSINFYQDVYKIYKGYGIKYLFTISFISSVIYCLFIFNYIVDLRNYFVTNQLSKNTATIEYIINQLPTIYYNGSQISVEEDAPLYLYDENKYKIAVIDPNNELSYNEKAKIPILFTSNKISIAVIEITEKKRNNINIEYSMLFGSDQKILTHEVIKKCCADILAKAPTIFIYYNATRNYFSIFDYFI